MQAPTFVKEFKPAPMPTRLVSDVSVGTFFCLFPFFLVSESKPAPMPARLVSDVRVGTFFCLIFLAGVWRQGRLLALSASIPAPPPFFLAAF